MSTDSTDPEDADTPDATAQVLPLVNAERARAGLPPLTPSAALATAALVGALEEAQAGQEGHPDPEGRLKRAGYAYRQFGEVTDVGPDAATVVAAWMASPKHREQLLHPLLIEAGFATAAAEDGTLYWMGDLGRPVVMPSPPPPSPPPPPPPPGTPPTATGLAVGVGSFDPTTGIWRLVGTDGKVQTFPFGQPGDEAFVGEWLGDGRRHIGVWRPITSQIIVATPAGPVTIQVPPGGTVPVWGHW